MLYAYCAFIPIFMESVFDPPNVIASTRAVAEEVGLMQRIITLDGDFSRVPEADLYLPDHVIPMVDIDTAHALDDKLPMLNEIASQMSV